jgi:hypothetical protein
MDDHHSHGAGASPECALCPVCVLLQAVTTSRPDVTAHLLAAGRELSLALAAAFEASADTFDRAARAHHDREAPTTAAEPDATPAPPRLQRVRIQ